MTFNTIQFLHTKISIINPHYIESNIVHCISCKTCNKKYMGQTSEKRVS